MSSSNKQLQSNNYSNCSVNSRKTAELINHFDELVLEYNKLKVATKSTIEIPYSALTSLTDRIQQIFLYLHKRNDTNSKDANLFSEDTYLLKNSETLIEILVYIGSYLNKNYDVKSNDFYLKYSQLITNLAETTPIRFGNSLIALNRLVEYSIELAFYLISDISLNKQLVYEVLRCLGALIYQNGSSLNNLNLNRLFGTCEHYSKSEFNQTTHGLLFTIRRLSENDMNSEFSLITSQILFNITMSSHNEAVPYIDDKYKIKSIYLLVRILRSHSSNGLTHTSDDLKVNNCKILTKSLQALENIFFSIQNLPEQSNWTQMLNFHLGDILAVAKNLSFHGIIRDSSRKQLSQNEEEKLQPSNVNILLDTNKKNKTNEDDKLSDDEDRQLSNSNNSNSKKLNYKNNSNNKRFTKTKSNQQSKQVALNETSLNSVQCLRDHQVPLLQLNAKNSNSENPISDSDLSADSNSTSKFYIEKCNAKVRVASLGVLLTAFQSLDKRTVLSYWDSFLGQSSNSKNYNLIWSARNDQSPKVRLIASTTLSTYLECVRSFFSLAACDNTTQTASLSSVSSSFVPMSYTIALLIRQLHGDLIYALNIESFSLNQIQLLKCLQCLIKATPYHKLKPGLVYKLMTSLNCQLNLKLKQNKNEQVIVEILTCLLLIITNHHQLAEVHLALISNSMRRESNTKVVASQVTDDLDSLSEKLEQISSVFKVPNLTQSRVTYFYTNEPTSTSQSYKSSLNESLNASGQMTPLFADLIGQESENTQKSWLVTYCLKYYCIMSSLNHKLVCLDLLQIICKKCFDLVRRDLFFDDLTQLIMSNLDLTLQLNQENEQILLKTLKLLEEFARCLATDELRTISNIDLNDCCKFWSSLLNSKLITHILTNEQYYLLSSSACDCLASIGASIFELLPFQKRIYCLTNLLHLTKSNSSLIRSSSVRALGVYVTFSSLKEDQNFLNDLSQCLLGLLSSDQNNLVRQKAAWSLSNLSEVLVENEDKLGKAFTDDFSLIIWMRLLDASSTTCVRESDKLKSYLVRTIGNLIRYITVFDTERIRKELKDVVKVEKLLTRSIDTLCQCRSVKMLKVKWNLSHAIGVAMHSFSTWQLQKNNTQWLLMLYDTLLDLFTQSTNFKVRINACIALMSINLADKSSDIYLKLNNSTESIFVKLWICLIDAFGKILNENIIDTTNESQHKTTLIHQLCKFFTYLCKNLRIDDLNELMLKCLNNVKVNSQRAHETFECITLTRMRSFFVDYIRNIFDQIEQNKQEVQYYNEALTHLNLLNSNKQNSLDEDCIQMLSSLLQKVTPRKTESESSETEGLSTDVDYRKKFPFSQVYD